MDIEEEVEILSKISLFNGISKQQLKLIAFAADLYYLNKDDTLCKQGDDADSAFVLLDGSLDVIIEKEENGIIKEIPVNSVGKHEIVGEIALLCAINRTATLRCKEDCTILCITKDTFDSLMDEFKEIPRALLHAMAGRIMEMNKKIASLQS